jgi:hypothetical protein
MASFLNQPDLTAGGVEFAAWATGVENDDLRLISLSLTTERTLTVVFFSSDKDRNVRFTFQDARAFRVVDEGGLLELWAASNSTPRPAQTTFLVRGHAWQAESPLAWFHGSDDTGYSYLVATDWDCLEVVVSEPPAIEVLEDDR